MDGCMTQQRSEPATRSRPSAVLTGRLPLATLSTVAGQARPRWCRPPRARGNTTAASAVGMGVPEALACHEALPADLGARVRYPPYGRLCGRCQAHPATVQIGHCVAGEPMRVLKLAGLLPGGLSGPSIAPDREAREYRARLPARSARLPRVPVDDAHPQIWMTTRGARLHPCHNDPRRRRCMPLDLRRC